MINKTKRWWKKREGYIDFTDDSWKNNFLIGLKITTRPFKKSIMIISVLLASLSLIIPDFGLGIFAAIKLLGKFG